MIDPTHMLPIDHPGLLWWLALLPLTWILLRMRARRRTHDFARAGMPPLPTRRMDRARNVALSGMWLAALACALVSAAGIRPSAAGDSAGRSTREWIIVLDVSRSMLAADVAPSRLEESLRQLREALKPDSDESIGVVVFAAEGLLVCPLTVDADAVQSVLKTLETPPVSGGTALAPGLSRAFMALPVDSTASQSIILVSDGEETEGDSLDSLAVLETRRVPVHAIAVGTTAGAPVPAGPEPGSEFQRDARGLPVQSRRVEAALRKVTERTGGTFRVLVPGRSTILQLAQEIRGQSRRAEATRGYDTRINWMLLVAALMLVAAEFALSPLGAERATPTR